MQPTSTKANIPALELARPAPAPVDTAPHATNCLHCGTLLADKFCAHCGQPADTHRITLRHLLLHDLPHSVWHVDKGIFYTLRQMLTRPGATLREYMAGQRAQHFRPITYLLLTTALAVLLMSLVHYSPVPPEGKAEMPLLLKLTMERYMQLYYKYAALVYVVLLPSYALLAVWLLRPVRFNFAEMLLSQAFVSGTTTVISTLVGLPVIMLASRFPALQPLIFVSMLPYMAYSAWVYYQLLEPTHIPVKDKWMRSIGTVILQTFVLLFSGILAFGGIMFILLRQDPSLIKELKKDKQKPSVTMSIPALRP